ncbi:AAC(3)-I family aminoglycoside N-acetyltransferase [Dehalogenimonas formicexedens]
MVFLVGNVKTEARRLKYTYRRLTGLDLPEMNALLKVFGEAFKEPATYQGNAPSEAYLKNLLDKTEFIVLVAFIGEEVIGGLAAYVLEKFEQERKEIYIYDLAVAERHRRRGVAKSLITKLKSIGRATGAYIIFVQADKMDTAAIRLYESLGEGEEVLNFDIPMT